MKFGKEFKTHLEQTLPEWRDKFLCYKPLKKLIKHYPNLPSTIDPIPTNYSLNFVLPPLQQPVSFDDPSDSTSFESVRDRCETGEGSLVDLQDWFLKILNEELEKLNDFYVDKEEEFVIRFQVLCFLFYFLCFWRLFFDLPACCSDMYMHLQFGFTVLLLSLWGI